MTFGGLSLYKEFHLFEIKQNETLKRSTSWEHSIACYLLVLRVWSQFIFYSMDWNHLPEELPETTADKFTQLQAAYRSLSILLPLNNLARLGMAFFFFLIVKELICRAAGEAAFREADFLNFAPPDGVILPLPFYILLTFLPPIL